MTTGAVGDPTDVPSTVRPVYDVSGNVSALEPPKSFEPPATTMMTSPMTRAPIEVRASGDCHAGRCDGERRTIFLWAGDGRSKRAWARRSRRVVGWEGGRDIRRTSQGVRDDGAGRSRGSASIRSRPFEPQGRRSRERRDQRAPAAPGDLGRRRDLAGRAAAGVDRVVTGGPEIDLRPAVDALDER